MKQLLNFRNILFIFVLTLFSCSSDSPEDRLTKRINQLVDVIESRDIQEFKTYLADDFSAVYGMNKLNKIRFIVFSNYQVKRNKNILVSLSDLNSSIEENHADVSARAVLVGAEDWLPERVQRYTIESRWLFREGEWYISRLRWRVTN